MKKINVALVLACIGLNIFGWALGFLLHNVLKPNPELFNIIEYSFLGTGWILIIICYIILNSKK